MSEKHSLMIFGLFFFLFTGMAGKPAEVMTPDAAGNTVVADKFEDISLPDLENENVDKAVEEIEKYLLRSKKINRDDVKRIRVYLKTKRADKQKIKEKLEQPMLDALEAAPEPDERTQAIVDVANDAGMEGKTKKQKILLKRADVFEKKGWNENEYTEYEKKTRKEIYEIWEKTHVLETVVSDFFEMKKKDERILLEGMMNPGEDVLKWHMFWRARELEPDITREICKIYLNKTTTQENSYKQKVLIDALYRLGDKDLAIESMKEGMIAGYDVALKNPDGMVVFPDMAEVYEDVFNKTKNDDIKIQALFGIRVSGDKEKAKSLARIMIKDMGLSEQDLKKWNSFRS